MTLTIIIAVFASAIRLATPLIFAALGGTFSERSGVVNIALEGMMLMGAFFAVLITHIFGSSMLGVFGAIVAGIVTALLLAFMSIHLRSNQVVVGTAINILAVSLTAYFLEIVWHRSGQTDILPKELSLTGNPKMFEFLEKIPVFGDVFSRFTPFVYLAFFMVFVSYYVLFKTPFGLRIRAVGEHPRAADTLGINVYKIRYICVMISGGLAGLAGASLSLGTVSLFREGMSVGKGFIALAAMIFGKWHPIGAMFACLFFGFTEAIQIQAQTIGINVPPEFLQMLPYIATILALAGVVGKATAPASDGIPYEKGEK
jgi:simple sugar transport system permease protein